MQGPGLRDLRACGVYGVMEGLGFRVRGLRVQCFGVDGMLRGSFRGQVAWHPSVCHSVSITMISSCHYYDYDFF